VRKVLQTKDLRPDFPVQVSFFAVKCEGPAFGRATFSIYFYFNESGITKMPHRVEIFLSSKAPYLFDFPVSTIAFG
jgi:hypothetical protein